MGQALLEWLGADQNYILEEVREMFGGPKLGWRLRHDSIAAALVEWKNDYLSHATYEGKDVFSPEESFEGIKAPAFGATSQLFRTMNDGIWDHLIPIYADEKGFAGRIGMRFKAEPKFDLNQSTFSPSFFQEFLSEKTPGTNRLVVLPGAVFNAV